MISSAFQFSHGRILRVGERINRDVISLLRGILWISESLNGTFSCCECSRKERMLFFFLFRDLADEIFLALIPSFCVAETRRLLFTVATRKRSISTLGIVPRRIVK